MVLRRDNPFGQLVVPDHKELDRGTFGSFANLIKRDEFIKLLKLSKLLPSFLRVLCVLSGSKT